MNLHGLIPPICTPLTDDGSLDRDSFQALIEHQIAAGADGLFVLGSSGEAIYLDRATRGQVADLAITTAGGRVPVLIGVLDATPARVVDEARWVSRDGAAGIVATAPYYAQVNARETAAHFRRIAAATNLPVFAYDTPSNVGERIDRHVLLELLADGTLVGLKDATGSLAEFRMIIDELGAHRNACLLIGADVLADLALDLGADGLIPGLANVRPDLFVELLRAHADGDRYRVRTYQRAIMALTGVLSAGEACGLGSHASLVGALKHLLKRQGVIASAAVSAPLTPLPASAAARIDRLMDQIDTRLLNDLGALNRRAVN